MTLDPTSQLVCALTTASAVMLILWLIQVATHDAGIVDVGWSATLGFLGIFYALTLPMASSRSWLIAVISAISSFRLATYLLLDRVIGKPEDGRYHKLRAHFGNRAPLFFLLFFQAQALLAWIFSLAFWLPMQRQGNLDCWDAAGSAIWVVSIVGESIADAQLARFRNEAQNKGKTCRVGLWHYSRHPNYFFEWIYWWVYVTIGWKSLYGWLTLFAPLLMLFFLFKLTGIPTAEAQALLNRGDDYRDYQQTTSVFVPWFPKKRRNSFR